MNETLKRSLVKIKEEQAKLRKEVKDKTIGYIIGALGLVAGLAWNDAIRSAIEYFFPLKSGSIFIKLSYAFLVTIIVVVASVYLLRSSESLDKKN